MNGGFMKTIWEQTEREELLARTDKLAADLPARWGKMDCPKMLAHVTDGMRMTMGEMEIAPKKSPLRFPPLRYLIIYVLPFPKGAPTAPELIERTPGEWEREIAEFKQVFARLVASSQRTDWPEHPAFGKLSAKDWGALCYKHLDHHFKQFGV